MSQPNVERVIGLLATDETLRRRFSKESRDLLSELKERGFELTESEVWSLSRLDPEALARFALAIDPRLQRSDLGGVRR